jgi:formiminotetrahydrofolate cyclodeaminase
MYVLLDRTVRNFLQELKSDLPAPGGGSAAALAGAMGAALVVMVGNLTLKNEKYGEVHQEVLTVKQCLEKQALALERFIDEDTAAFNQVMAAYRLPKEGEADKIVRNEEIQRALQLAACLPLQVAEAGVKVLAAACRMLEIGNRNAASDAAAAARMAYAAVWAAIYNVRINLSGIKDDVFAAKMRQQVSDVLAEGEANLQQALQLADKKIGL